MTALAFLVVGLTGALVAYLVLMRLVDVADGSLTRYLTLLEDRAAPTPQTPGVELPPDLRAIVNRWPSSHARESEEAYFMELYAKFRNWPQVRLAAGERLDMDIPPGGDA